MQENRGAGPNFELNLPPSPETEQGREQAAEAPPSRQEQVGKQPKQPALPAIPDDIPAAGQPIITAPPDITSPVPTDPKSAAADNDHIEREWVDKVKNVVARTQDDPHLQKEQMSKVKAEYIQKRFNKTIKTDEAAA
jgi:hypothetical protein